MRVTEIDLESIAGLGPTLEALVSQVERVQARLQKSGLEGCRAGMAEWRLNTAIRMLRKTRDDLDPEIGRARQQVERDLADEERRLSGGE